MTFEKIGYWDQARTHQRILGFGFLVSLSVFFHGLLAFLWTRLSKAKGAQTAQIDLQPSYQGRTMLCSSCRATIGF